MTNSYAPPFALTPKTLGLVVQISEEIGRQGLHKDFGLTPALRRGARLRSIQASLAIENNTLSLEQVTAVISGKRVLGPPQEIQEVRNAFAAYEMMGAWTPFVQKHLLAAHGLLMRGLIEGAEGIGTGVWALPEGKRSCTSHHLRIA